MLFMVMLDSLGHPDFLLINWVQEWVIEAKDANAKLIF